MQEMNIALILVGGQILLAFIGFIISIYNFRRSPKGSIIRPLSIIFFLEMWLLGGVGISARIGLPAPDGEAVSPLITNGQLLIALLILVCALLWLGQKESRKQKTPDK